MTDYNSTAIKHWLLLSLAGFGFGTILGGVTQQNLQKALVAGAVGAPIACVGGLLFNPRQSIPSYHSISSSSFSASPVPHAPALANSGHPIGPMTTQSHVAIFWDYENINVSNSSRMVELAQAIVNIAQQKGHSRQKFVYANWRREPRKTAQSLTSHGFTPIHVAMGKPNSVDVQLAVDCISTAYQYPEIKHFILVTSDKDYISLVNKLQELQREVVLIGNDQTNTNMRESANHFMSLSQILRSNGLVPNTNQSLSLANSLTNSTDDKLLSFEEGMQCLLSVLEQKTRPDHSQFALSHLNVMMRDAPESAYQNCSSVLQPDGQHPFAKFSDFIQAVAATGKIKTIKQHPHAYASLANNAHLGLTFEEARQCVLYALALDHQQNQNEQYQAGDAQKPPYREVNIAHLAILVRQHLGFSAFTPTKISIQRKEGRSHYSTLSKFLDDVAKTQMVEIRRDEKGVYIKLLDVPHADLSHEAVPPKSLLMRLSGLQAEISPGSALEPVADLQATSGTAETDMAFEATNETIASSETTDDAISEVSSGVMTKAIDMVLAEQKQAEIRTTAGEVERSPIENITPNNTDNHNPPLAA